MTETNFFGEVKKVDHQRLCKHANFEASLPVMGIINIRSTYEAGTDRVVETERSLSWSGNFQGRCLDCGRDLYYGYSSITKRLWSRLRLLRGTFSKGKYDPPDSIGRTVIDPGKQVRKED